MVLQGVHGVAEAEGKGIVCILSAEQLKLSSF